MNRIKEILSDKDIKHPWLAEKLGKSYNMVNDYAQSSQPTKIKALYKIMKILKVHVKSKSHQIKYNGQ